MKTIAPSAKSKKESKQAGHPGALEFLHALFGGALAANRRIAIWTKADKRTRAFTACEAAADYSVQRAVSSDVYVCIGLFNSPPAKRGTANEVTGVPALWADVDTAGPNHQTAKAYPPDEKAALGVLSSVALPPSITVRTGGGLHAYWLLDEPWTFAAAADRQRAADDLRRWEAHVHRVAAAAGFQLDSVADLARVMRVPGTLNHKSADPKPVEVVDWHPERRYGRAEVLAASKPPVAPPAGPKVALAGRVAGHELGGLPLPPPTQREALYAQLLDLRLSQEPKLHGLWTDGRWQASGYPSHSEADLALCNRIAVVTLGDAGLTDRVFRLSRLYRSKWDEVHYASGETYGQRTVRKALERYEAKRARPKSESPPKPPAADIPPVAPCTAGRYPLTDLGNAERFLEQHGNTVVFSGGWRVYTGQRWADDPGTLGQRAKHTVRSMYAEAQATPGDDQRVRVNKHAVASESAPRIRAMLRLAEMQAPAAEAWDRDPWLLNVQNGTVDLRTGGLLPHRREDRLTRLAPARYDEHALCPRWDQFLLDVTDGDRNLVSFLQRGVGYSLSGDTGEGAVFVLLGAGRNGKSTFLEAVARLLGDAAHGGYGNKLDAAALHRTRSDVRRYDVAALRSVRFAYVAERIAGGALDVERLKELTGGETVSARLPYQPVFNFRPRFKLWVGTNDPPRVRHDDPALWDRLKLVEFNRRFYDSPREAAAACGDPSRVKDKHLLDALRRETPGILAWAVRGCLDWQRHGLGVPRAVRGATARHQRRMDVVEAFLDECCVRSETAFVPSAALWSEFAAWSEPRGGALPRVEFTRRFGSLVNGAPVPKRVKGKLDRCWLGVALRPQ